MRHRDFIEFLKPRLKYVNAERFFCLITWHTVNHFKDPHVFPETPCSWKIYSRKLLSLSGCFFSTCPEILKGEWATNVLSWHRIKFTMTPFFVSPHKQLLTKFVIWQLFKRCNASFGGLPFTPQSPRLS